MVEVRELVKRYGDHLAVDQLSFAMEKGRIYGFLGPNGAGKSTTMNIMTGYLGPSSGDVIVDGHSILEEPETVKRSIGYLPEQPPLYADMTVNEYLTFAAELRGIPKVSRKDKVQESVDFTGLKEVRGRMIRNLSKGYRQRVGLAQAILGFPEIIILDEPTVGLDPKQILEIRSLIRKLGKDHTVILSSHILSEVQEICDHVLIIHHGRLWPAAPLWNWSARSKTPPWS
jgi:ABC-2 type transport system ATP-binding protein